MIRDGGPFVVQSTVSGESQGFSRDLRVAGQYRIFEQGPWQFPSSLVGSKQMIAYVESEGSFLVIADFGRLTGFR